MGVGSLETAEIPTVKTDTRHEKAHRRRRFGARLCGLLSGQNRSGHNGCGAGKNKNTSLHLDLLVKSRRRVTRQALN
jgi:hypothetical protein